MTNVQIRDVPEPVVDTLRSAASRRGESLQRYLAEVLACQARVEATAGVMSEAAADAATSAAAPFDAAAVIREARDERARILTGGQVDQTRSSSA
jgi:type II secretory pathway component PulM